jgi:ribosomal protein S18 acetylase RimI-like enzyme
VHWSSSDEQIDWQELSALYRSADMGEKLPHELRVVFAHSMFKCFLFDNARLIGAGRALADGRDCAYLCDIAIHPDFQRQGLGRSLIRLLMERCAGHRKIILYAKPGREQVYRALGFRRMSTAMAMFADQEAAQRSGLIE